MWYTEEYVNSNSVKSFAFPFAEMVLANRIANEIANGTLTMIGGNGAFDPVIEAPSHYDPEEFDGEEAAQLCEDFNE